MAQIALDIARVRASCPLVADETAYPDDAITAAWDGAVLMVSSYGGRAMSDAARTKVLDHVTGHIALLTTGYQQGQGGGIVQSSAIDKISVSFAVSQPRSFLAEWLRGSPCGQMALALLQAHSKGGYYSGGSPEVSGARRWGGIAE